MSVKNSWDGDPWHDNGQAWHSPHHEWDARRWNDSGSEDAKLQELQAQVEHLAYHQELF